MNIGIKICATAKTIYQHLNKSFLDLNITPEQWIVLNTLCKSPKISQKELSELTQKDQNTIKAIVDKLVVKDLVIRKTNQNDKRAFILSPTKKAKELALICTKIDNIMLDKILSVFKNKNELDYFINKLDNIQKSIENERN
ncbi:MarR family winged helix-turn-helix transcriptional regulator [Campylobacter sp. RM12647]|uniref:MarR family winged helix-turn-helix transcriptional regulator n=1 Tax=Campylobacter sp. RM12647 TaxID=2735737 RepID=UPI001DB45D3E|nr:winged helix-turn-helix transcriptional regulator [Campylobacter sp. RM12647]